MMCLLTLKRFLSCLTVGLALAPLASAQSWPSYNGDFTGRRFSALAQIHTGNVRSLTLAWAFPTHGLAVKGTPLMVDGVVYFTSPDHAWALDARTGEKIWAWSRPSKGNHIAQRGPALYKGRLYFGTPDAHLICLDAGSGKQLWDVEVADSTFGYYLSVAPLIVKGMVMVGTSGDQTNIPHSLEARSAETGALLWQTSSLPPVGSAAADTWPNAQAMSRGGGPMWLTGTYDPDLNLVYWGTGNPHPVLDGKVRAGDNLYTCSILALNPDTGAIAWSFQPSPHDTHDWDAVETPVLFDGVFEGKPRKLLAQASRNGYYFLLDRATGKALVTAPYVTVNFASGVDGKGQPVPDPAKEPQLDGALIAGAANGGTNWMPPAFNPSTGLLYVDAYEGFSFWYRVVDENGAPVDHQGGGSIPLLTESSLVAIDAMSGKVRWRRELGSGTADAGVLTTAGGLVFSGDLGGNLLGLDAKDGKVLWHTRVGALSNGPMSYEVDGRQFLVTAVGDVLYAWSLPE
jgi:alcohol dehydrogenase (cytochrome c)